MEDGGEYGERRREEAIGKSDSEGERSYRRGRRGENMKGIDVNEADSIMLCWPGKVLVSRDSLRTMDVAVSVASLSLWLSLYSQQLENRRC